MAAEAAEGSTMPPTLSIYGRHHAHTPISKARFYPSELLVVVAVIALLLAILLPALSAASEAGRAAGCGANEGQLLQVAIAYQDDNDGSLPWYAFPNLRPEGEQWWVTRVARSMDQF